MLTLKWTFLLEAAKTRWISIEIIDETIPLFFMKKGKKKLLFQNDNGWMNSSLGNSIAKNKHYTYKILEHYHIPYPTSVIIKKGQSVDTVSLRTTLWYPLVVKPANRWCGKGISIVFHPHQLPAALMEAGKFWKTIIIQRFINGDDYRIMVVGDKIIAWLKRMPASVIGDGKHTIKELIHAKNTSPQRWKSCAVSILTEVKIDVITKRYLKDAYGYTLQTIPKKKRRIFLRGNSNLSTWWDAEDITDIIHPKFKRICIKLARLCSCPIVWVDIIAWDISKDPAVQERAVIELNDNAQYNIHQTDIFGTPRDVAGAILDLYFWK